jgi:hypothetical protein
VEGGNETVKSRIIYFALLAAAVLAYFNNVLTGESIFIERDLSVFFIPPKVLWADMIKQGMFPFWNPYNYSGIPLLATLQPGVLYPPHVLYLVLPFNIAWNWMVVLHFLLAAASIYALIKYLKASDEAALVGGIIYTLSGYLLSVHNLVPHLYAVSWFPLIVLCLLRYFETGKARAAVVTAILLVVQFLSGAPEIVILTGLVLVILTFFAPAFVETPARLPSRLCGVVGIVLLCVLLSSFQLLPLLELKSWSIRQGGLTYREAGVWSLAWRDFLQFLIPDPYGNFMSDKNYWFNQSWLKTIYLGIIPFFLSAFFFVTKDRRRVVFLVLIFVSFIFALGFNTPLYQLLYKVPPFNSLRYPVKFLFLFFFVISITAGMGLDKLRQGVAGHDRRVTRTAQVAFYTGFLFALLWAFVTIYKDPVIAWLVGRGFVPEAYNFPGVNLHDIRRFSFFSFIFCIMVLVYVRVRFKRTVLAFIILILGADLFLASYGYYSVHPWKDYMAPHPFAEKLADDRDTARYFVTPKTDKTYPLFPRSRQTLSAPFAALFGLYSVDGAEVLRISPYDKFLYLLKNAPSVEDAARFLDISGVRYLISSIRIESPAFKELMVHKVNDAAVYLYEYVPYRGRFLLYSRARTLPTEKAVIDGLLDKKLDLSRELLVQGREAGIEELPEGAGRVSVASYLPNRVVLKSETAHDAFLYVTDTYYPGWKAYVDGKETPIMQANLAYRAVRVPAGAHEVVFSYRPVSFYLGVLVTFFALIAALFIVRRSR